MKRNWFVVPDAVRITLPDCDGDWIDVKKRLTHGEREDMNAMIATEVRSDGRVTPNFKMVRTAQAFMYLVDWSIKDAHGNRVKIESDTAKLAALNAMDPELFDIIKKAVEDHIGAMDAERELEKNGPSASPESVLT